MDNGIYIALSRQMGLFRDMAVTANNIANSTTTGFNAENMLFTSYMVDDGNRNKMAFAQDIATVRDTSEGPMQATGNQFDLAISGKGYFVVESPLGNRYTRAGNFQVDKDGTLISAEGYPVLDAAGQRIQFEENDQKIVVGEAGNISVNGEERGEIGVVQFDNEQQLNRLDGRLLSSDVTPGPGTSFKVVQGMLEGSNVKPVLELTRMIEVSRGVATTAKYIENMYDLERKAANTWAKQAA